MFRELQELPEASPQADFPRSKYAEFRFLLELGHALLTYGLPANQLEGRLHRLGLYFGFEGRYFATPTGSPLFPTLTQ
jgi:hypothetical protein